MMRIATQLLLLSTLCAFALGQTEVWLIVEGSESNRATVAANFQAADATGAAFTVTLDDDITNSILQDPIPTNFDMVVYVKSDQTWSSQGALGDAYRTNLEAFADNGNVVMVTGYDCIASATDATMIAFLGGNSSEDSSSIDDDENDVGNFSTDTGCASFFDGPFGNLYGLDPYTNFISDLQLGDSDSLLISSGPAVPCWELDPSYGTYTEAPALFAARPMSNGGSVNWMTCDDDDAYSQFTDTSNYFWAAYNNLISFAATAGVGGDPHIFGFDGSREDLMVDDGTVVNVISDRDLQVNMATVTFPEVASFFSAFVGQVGFQTASGDAILFDAVSADDIIIAINGVSTSASEMPDVVGASFAITRDVVTRGVPMHLSKDLNTPSMSFTVDFDRYTFNVLLMDDFWPAVDRQARYLDFTVRLHGSSHTPTGVLGRTIHAHTEKRDFEGLAVEDFLVADGIFGSDFKDNQFFI